MAPSATRIDDAKRALGRALRAQDGFAGVGVGADGVRLYARSEEAAVVRYFRSRYGRTYRGFPVSIDSSSGFRPTGAEAGIQRTPRPSDAGTFATLASQDPSRT